MIMEKQIKRKEILKGRVIHVTEDTVLLDNGEEALRECVYHRGGACIALKDPSDNKYFLVKQFRYVPNKEMLEFCAGKIEEGENPDDSVLRESQEELGFVATNVTKLGSIIPTCGYDSEIIYLYHGIVGERVGQHLDEDENLNVFKYSFNEIKELINNGTIDDAKTIALMYKIELKGLE